MLHIALRRRLPGWTLASALAATGLLVVPALAAAEPTVSGPTAASLKASKPAFTITRTPDSRPQQLSLSQSSKLNSLGELEDSTETDGGARIDIEDTTTIAAADHVMYAGTYFWQLVWRPLNPNGTTGDVVYSPLGTFKIPAYVRKPAIKAPYQDPKFAQVGFTGTYVSNASATKWTCVIKRGSRVIASKKRNDFPTAGAKSRWECLDMHVPESNDGKTLTLTLKVSGGGKSASATRSFVSK